jgi:hypothetical protein
LSTSATDTIREHNRSIVRTPLTAPAVARVHSSCCSTNPRIHGARAGGWARGTANRDFTGQGPRRLAPTWLPPPRSLAVEASPQPDRLGHPMSQVRDAAGRSDPAPPEHPRRDTLLRTRPTSLTCARTRATRAGLLHVFSREGEPQSATPEVPSITGPPHKRWSFFHKLSPACGLKTGASSISCCRTR